jgi:NCS1 family nucleobase:cation symporter-1
VEHSAFGRLPMAVGEREYGMLSAHGICFAYAIATWCFLVGSYAASLLPALDGALCLIAGNLIGVFLTTMPLSLGCQRYGIEQMDFCKTAFGQRGSHVLLLFYLVNMLGWSGLLLVMFSNGLINIAHGFGVETGGLVLNAGVALAMVAAVLVALKGVHRLASINNLVTPLLGLVLLYMLYMLFVARGHEAVFEAAPLDPYPDPLLNYATVLELGIANGFSWWGGIGFIARNTRSRRAAVYPQMLQLGLGSGVVSSVAMCCALVVGSDDPTQWMMPLGGVLLGALALGIMGIANLTAVAISLFAAALAMRHVPLLRHRAWWQVLLIASLPCVMYAIWPQQLYDRGEAFLAYNGTMYAPISGILFVDYLLLRRQKLCLRSLFDAHPERAYHYWRGFNPLALGGLVLGQVVYFALYNPVTGDSHWLFRYLPASIAAFAVPALVYWIGMRWHLRAGVAPAQPPQRMLRPTL